MYGQFEDVCKNIRQVAPIPLLKEAKDKDFMG